MIKGTKKPKIWIFTIIGALILAGATYYLFRTGVISADTAQVNLKFVGTIKTFSGHPTPNRLVPGANVAIGRYYPNTNCTGTSSVVSITAVADSQGKLTLNGLKNGCYKANISGQVLKRNIGSPLNIIVPKISLPLARNLTTTGNTYRLTGTFSPMASGTITPTAGSTSAIPAQTYKISGVLKDASGNPVPNIRVSNVSPQHNLTPRGDCPLPTVGSIAITSASSVTDSTGKYTLNGLPRGCFTIKFNTTCPVGRTCPNSATDQTISIKIPANSTGTTTITLPNGQVVTYTVSPSTSTPPPTPTPTTPTPPSTGSGTVSGQVILKDYQGLQMLAPNNGVIEFATSNRGPWSTLANILNGNYSGSLNPGSYLLRAKDINNPRCVFGQEDSLVSTDLIPITVVNGSNSKNIILNCSNSERDVARIVLKFKFRTTGEFINSGAVKIRTQQGVIVGEATTANTNGEWTFDVPGGETYRIFYGFSGFCPLQGNPIPKDLLPNPNTTPQTIQTTKGNRSYKTLELYCPNS